MKYLKVKNWEQFQHFKDRRPPWIKLYKDLLDDYLFHSLPVESRALAPMLWLMASEHEPLGTIKYDIRMISFRLRMTEQEVEYALKPLIDNNLFILDINMISQRHSNDIPETETYSKEKEIKKERERNSQNVKELIFSERFQEIALECKLTGEKASNCFEKWKIARSKNPPDDLESNFKIWCLNEKVPTITEQEDKLSESDYDIQRLGIIAWKKRNKMNINPDDLRFFNNYEKMNGTVWWNNLSQFKEDHK